MVQEIRLTKQTQDVLAVMIDRVNTRLSGADIARETKLASGSLYPILSRLEKAGWLSSEWELEEPSTLGRPRRRLYRITAEGQRQARSIVQRFTPASGVMSWA